MVYKKSVYIFSIIFFLPTKVNNCTDDANRCGISIAPAIPNTIQTQSQYAYEKSHVKGKEKTFRTLSVSQLSFFSLKQC